MLNSVLLSWNKGAKFCTFDISNFYLCTPLDRPEYIKIKLSGIPQQFIDKYNLMEHVHNDWAYFEIRKGIYGLLQSGILAQKLLAERLARKVTTNANVAPQMATHHVHSHQRRLWR
jgi:hypothetical protein